MSKNEFLTLEYKTIRQISGPLIFIENVGRVCMGELVSITLPGGVTRRGQVIELSEKHVVVQVMEETTGMTLLTTGVHFTGHLVQMDLSLDLLGRRFNGAGFPIDHLPPVIPDQRLPIMRTPINPISREKPAYFIETGISAIDGLNTLVLGQKLPIFSEAGLPAKEIAVQILKNANLGRKATGSTEEFAIVFAGIGVPFLEAAFFLEAFEEGGRMAHTVVFLNLADDPSIERLLTPRLALTTAEFLAFEHDFHVLVILTDMTNYCEALREIAMSREEIPGRRGYPGYMYTDLATLYERAGRIKGKKGSVTQIPILTMPDDDITHPIPDLTGYITEGQIVLSRELHRKGIFPPIDVLPSLSRLMNLGIGPGKTRDDHRQWADQLYALYAQGRELRKLEAIVGQEGLTETDNRFLDFAKLFEDQILNQGNQKRSLLTTFEIGWKLMASLPKTALTRIKPELIGKYYPESD